jgi:hypothetical protein
VWVYLCLRVILALLVSPDDRPSLVRVYEIALVITDYTSRAGEHQRLDTGTLAGVHHSLGAVDVDLLEQGMGDTVGALGRRRCGMDDDVWLGLLEYRRQLLGVGYVGLEVLDVVGCRSPVPDAAQVDYGDGGCVVAQEEIDDVVAQEAAAADYEDAAQVVLRCRSHCGDEGLWTGLCFTIGFGTSVFGTAGSLNNVRCSTVVEPSRGGVSVALGRGEELWRIRIRVNGPGTNLPGLHQSQPRISLASRAKLGYPFREASTPQFHFTLDCHQDSPCLEFTAICW